MLFLRYVSDLYFNMLYINKVPCTIRSFTEFNQPLRIPYNKPWDQILNTKFPCIVWRILQPNIFCHGTNFTQKKDQQSCIGSTSGQIYGENRKETKNVK